MIGADAVRGHIDLMVLSILEKEPSYAYEISRIITTTSQGEYTIKQTSLYTAVKRLENQGCLLSEERISDSGKPRTYYFITSAGKDQLTQKRREWAQTRELIDYFAHSYE